ncbi:MAG: extracellular solute-binding protein [Caldilineaceae bacterium]|nr:extracellular solute-binding protein [Caldilineaceae bacterium]
MSDSLFRSQKLTRRGFLTGIAASAASAYLVACAPAPVGAPAEEGAAPAAGEPVELVFWGFASNRIQWEQEVFDTLFQPEHPEVSVAFESVPQPDIWDKLQATFVAGSGAPDMIDLHIRNWLRFTKDVPPFVDLSDLIGEEAGNLVEGSALAPWTSHGKRCAVGNELNTALLYYRWDVFDEAGIDADALATWDDFVQAGEEIMGQTGQKLLTVEEDNYYKFYLEVTQHGGQFFSETGEPVVNNEHGVAMLSWEQNLLRDREVAMIQPAGNPAYFGAMNQSEFVVDMGAPWFQGFMKQQAPDVAGLWHMRPLPAWPDGEGFLTSQRGGTGMGITNQSQHSDVCWDFIRTCNLTVDGVMLGYNMANLFPTYKPAWEDEGLMRTDEYFDNQVPAEFIMAAADQMPLVNTSAYWSDLSDALVRLAKGPVLRDGADPQASLDAVVAEVKALMG